MNEKMYRVDSFTDKAFAGNPAAVCVLHKPREKQWMQQVAAEMNLSETAFVLKQNGNYLLQWFTPVCEVALCGHATLATAHILWDEQFHDPDANAVFLTKSGVLIARKKEHSWIELDFPSLAVYPHNRPESFKTILGVDEIEILFFGKTDMDYIIELDSAKAVRAMKPDFVRLEKALDAGLVVTAASDMPQFDFISRVFAPSEGINEDPVTGSAHCILGPYWARKTGQDEFSAFQASSRGGVLRVRVEKDRTYLGGQAVTVFKGSLGY